MARLQKARDYMPQGTDWSAIRAEYIAGGISQRKLARKYGVSFNTLKDIANAERWAAQRGDAHNKATTKAQQKIVVALSDRLADLATKKDTLARELVTATIDTLHRYQEAGKLTPQNIKFLTGAYKDLTAKDVPLEEKPESGTLAEAISAAASEVWDDADDIPV